LKKKWYLGVDKFINF